MGLLIDTYTNSINKYGEELCGNKVEVIRNASRILAIMVAGPDGGIKGNILASLTLKMIASMLVQDEEIEDTIKAILDVQSADTNKEGYPAFTIIRILSNGTGYIAEVDMPAVVFLNRGKPVETFKSEKTIGGKNVKEERFTLKPGDILTVFNGGILNAGMAGRLKTGWGRQLVVNYLQAAYKPKITAKKVTSLLLTAGSSLDHDQPAEDLTVITFCANVDKSLGAG